MTRFEQILFDLGKEWEIELYPDQNRVCQLNYKGQLHIQLQYDERKEMVKKYSQGLDYFSLLLGLLWIFVGLRNLFAWLNLPDLDVFVFRWFSGPLTYLHLIPLFYYFGWSFFRNTKVRLLFNWISTLLVLLVVFIGHIF